MSHIDKVLCDQGQCCINKGQMIETLGNKYKVWDNPNSVGQLEILGVKWHKNAALAEHCASKLMYHICKG